MSLQPESQSALAQSENPMVRMIRMMAILDPHHMVAVMQKLFPFATAIPGLDAAGLTEIHQKNYFAILNASTNIQNMLNVTAMEEHRMLQEYVIETLQQISCAGAPKQMELVSHLIDKLSKDTIELMQRNSEQTIAIMKDMRRRYIAALDEIKQMSQQST